MQLSAVRASTDSQLCDVASSQHVVTVQMRSVLLG